MYHETQYSMVIGCVRLTDIGVIDMIRNYEIENREKVWGGLLVQSVQSQGKTELIRTVNK